MAEELAGVAVDEMEPQARRASEGFVFMVARARPVHPVLHVEIGSGADEDQVHGATIATFALEMLICRKVGPR